MRAPSPSGRRRRLAQARSRACAALALALSAPAARAAESGDGGEWWLVGGQATGVGQYQTGVPGPYYDPKVSFGPEPGPGWSFTASLYAGAAPWRGAVAVVEPEYANGHGMPNVSGLAGYPDGDIIRVAKVGTAPYVARAYLQQVFALDPRPEEDEGEDAAPESRFMPSGPLALRRARPRSRVEITAGKFASNDFFDVADASSDPRHSFMNWALMNQGAWDYAADTRGYTWGVVAALETPRWAVRGGVTLMPTTANGPVFDGDLQHARSEMVEGEVRWQAPPGGGSAKLLLYANHARMGSYRDALAAASPGSAPSVDAVARVGAVKYGAGLLVQQAVEAASLFVRAGWNDGQTETFAFTEIDRSVSAGVVLDGRAWGRGSDRAGLAVAASGLSPDHARYLEAGGRGFQLGDGGLSYAWETLAEIYYLVELNRLLEVTADLQGVVNPGMNAARGPTLVAGLRLHAHM